MERPLAENSLPTVIRTPDQRLRVFISSTLQELAVERAAVSQAVSSLHLIPVLFELGARPHPPRDLYRAYLAQSHIFIGIYWERYGWVAPDMDISGLEDEYRLARELPKLIYIKMPAPERDSRMKELLSTIKNDDDVSYKYFATAEELGDLVQNDLALLLTERFEQAAQRSGRVTAVVPEKDDRRFILPQPLTRIIGREAEVQAVRALFTQPHVRLVTLVGPGGVGKTRLSLEVASGLTEQFRDGVYWAPLAAIETPDLVVSAIAQVLDVRERGGYPLLESVKAYLHDKKLLLLLDNLEQVIEAGPVLAELLSAAPGLTMLVTSRAPLRLRGEQEFPVSPLPLPAASPTLSLEQVGQNAAVRLFVERAQAAQPAFDLTEENAAAVGEIVRRLDGLPLAIELAAARVKLLPPHAMLQRLEGGAPRLKLLTGGAQDLPARQQTIRNAIEWSYSLLDAQTQTLFTRLAVFVGGFTLEAAEAVANQEGELDVLEGVASLVNNSLLQQAAAIGDQPRFAMLETLREYALERLTEKDEAVDLRRRHAEFFAERTAEAAARFFSGESEKWLDHLAADYNNLRAALLWLQNEPASLEATSRALSWQMIINLEWLWYRRGYLNEARQWYERAIQQTAGLGQDVLRANLLQAAGSTAMWRSDLTLAAQLMDEGLQILRTCGEATSLAVALFRRGVLATNQGDADQASRMMAEALPLLQAVGQQWFQAMTLLHLGNVALSQGEMDTARQRMKESLALGRQVGDDWIIASAINSFGEIARYEGAYEEACGHYLESQALFRRVGSSPDVARAIHSWAYVALSRGEQAQARALFQESLALHQQLGVKRGVVEGLIGLAAVLSTEGEAETAARLLAAGQAQFAALGTSSWPADYADFERALARIQAQLDESRFATAYKAGEAMSLDEALRLVVKAG